MTDTLSPKQRSALMSKVRGGDTKPEWILRCGLHRLGFRYGLRNQKLPGKQTSSSASTTPLSSSTAASGTPIPIPTASCPRSQSNREFWQEKLDRNTTRDARNQRALQDAGWRVFVVWECELLRDTVATIERVAKWLRADTPAARPYKPANLDRRTLLKVAEAKVRYRIDRYDPPADRSPQK